MLRDFRKFILRGNVVDLAVGIVIGAAFVKGFITPLIAAIGGQPDFSGIFFTINNSRFLVGEFINAVVSFLIIAAVVFFLVVKPVNVLMTRFKSEEPEPTPQRECPYCASRIPQKATRCAFCTQEVPPLVAATVGGTATARVAGGGSCPSSRSTPPGATAEEERDNREALKDAYDAYEADTRPPTRGE